MDFAVPNAAPGRCEKCRGSGQFRWGASVNGAPPKHGGPCWSCQGSGRQDHTQIKRNEAFNRYQMRRLASV